MQIRQTLLVLAALPILALGAERYAEDGYAGQRGFEFHKQKMAQLQALKPAPAAPVHPVVDLKKADPPFYTDKSKKFYVDGKKIPEVDWDAGPSYSGLLPISGDKNETRKLFFWQVHRSTSESESTS